MMDLIFEHGAQVMVWVWSHLPVLIVTILIAAAIAAALVLGRGVTLANPIFVVVGLAVVVPILLSAWKAGPVPGTPTPEPPAKAQIRECQRNLHRIKLKVTIYAKDHGRAPDSLEQLGELPICPSAATSGYAYSHGSRRFTVLCRGANHLDGGLPADRPLTSDTLPQAR